MINCHQHAPHSQPQWTPILLPISPSNAHKKPAIMGTWQHCIVLKLINCMGKKAHLDEQNCAVAYRGNRPSNSQPFEFHQCANHAKVPSARARMVVASKSVRSEKCQWSGVTASPATIAEMKIRHQ